MSDHGRPVGVVRWVRRPLWWAGAGVALVVLVVVGGVAGARQDRRTFEAGYRVGAEIIGSAGEGDLLVQYEHPTLDGVAVVAVPGAPGRPSDSGERLVVEVDRSDPGHVVVAGARRSPAAGVLIVAPTVVVPLLLWATRKRTLRSTQALMASDEAAFLMLAVPAAPARWGLRWRLLLHPVDTGSAAPAVCAVPLVDRPDCAEPFMVEVKGDVRPSGRVAARHHDGPLLWPAGRALQRVPRLAAGGVGPTARRAPSWRHLLWAGAALLVVAVVVGEVGDSARVVRERQETVVADVVAVERHADGLVERMVVYEVEGISRRGTLTEPARADVGSGLVVRVDPLVPTRVWSLSAEDPPGTNDGHLRGVLVLGALVVLAAGWFVRFRGGPESTRTGAADAGDPSTAPVIAGDGAGVGPPPRFRLRGLGVGAYVGAVAILAFFGWVTIREPALDASPFGPVAVGLAVLVAFQAAWIEVRIDADEVRVRNPWRWYCVTGADIGRISSTTTVLPATGPASYGQVTVTLRSSGRVIRLAATTGSNPERIRQVVDRLAAIAGDAVLVDVDHRLFPRPELRLDDAELEDTSRPRR